MNSFRRGDAVEVFEKNQAGNFEWQDATVIDVRREGIANRVDKIQVKTPEGRMFFFYGAEDCIRPRRRPEPALRCPNDGRVLDPYGNCDRAYDHA